MEDISFTSAAQRARSLVGTSDGRPQHDFYPTPPEATEALLNVERFSGDIWEPACGDGAICRVLHAAGLGPVRATDLIDRGWGQGGVDFLATPPEDRAANVITNPPFKLAEAFAQTALARTTGKVALLGKLQFLEGAKRRRLFETSPLARVWVFSKRLSLTREGQPMANGGMIAFAWYVWEHGHQGRPVLGWL